MKKINLEQKFSQFQEHWSPKILGQANGQLIKIAKGKGELVWHSHENEDEVFLVIKGQLTLKMHEGDVVLGPGELYVVSKGMEHCPVANEETHFLMIEPASTAHTGEVDSEQTVAPEQQQWI